MKVDLLIIGGGMSGLVHAYNNKNKSILLIEKNKELGGRARQFLFGNTLLPGGAGIGRLSKDRALYNLIKELTGEEPYKFKSNIQYYGVEPIDMETILKDLENEFNKDNKSTKETFKEFFIRIKGEKIWKAFCNTAGYTDFQYLNVKDAIYNYGFKDTYGNDTKFSVPWNKIIDILEEKIKSNGGNIMTETTVKKIINKNKVILSNETEVEFNNYLLCTPPSAIVKTSLKYLLNPEVLNYVSHIKGQHFCYLYAKIDIQKSQEFVNTFKTYTVVPQPLQTVIPMDPQNGIYMIGYADNENALYLKNIIKKKSKRLLQQLVEEVLGMKIIIKDYKLSYWNEGTHYRDKYIDYKNYSHLKGEAFALNQGWTNGGLLSS